VLLDLMVQLVPRDQLVNSDHRDLVVMQDHLDLLETLEQQAQQEPMVVQEQLGQKE
jgi:hypothetical protein